MFRDKMQADSRRSSAHRRSFAILLPRLPPCLLRVMPWLPRTDDKPRWNAETRRVGGAVKGRDPPRAAGRRQPSSAKAQQRHVLRQVGCSGRRGKRCGVGKCGVWRVCAW